MCDDFSYHDENAEGELYMTTFSFRSQANDQTAYSRFSFRPRRRRQFLPQVESLEDRCLLSTSGFTQVPLPSKGPAELTAGPDGNMWYANSIANLIGRISPSGAVTEFPVSGAFAPQN